MKLMNKSSRFLLMAISAASLFIVSSSCKRQQQTTKYGPIPADYNDQSVTKYGVVIPTDTTTITKYGVPVPENE